MKKILFAVLIAAFSLAGCSPADNDIDSKQVDINTTTVTFHENFLNLAGKDSAEMVSYLKDMGAGYFENLYINSDDTVSMDITKEQAIFWNDRIAEKLNQKESELKSVSNKYYAACSADYKEINVYYDMNMTFQDAFAYIGDTAIYCAMYQLINGCDNFSLSLNIYNADTGKLVSGGNLIENISYGNAEWSTSYQLTEEEEQKLILSHGNSKCASYVLDSTFIDPISVIDIFCTANGNEYTYLYINADGKTVIGLNEEERINCINLTQKYIQDIQAQFMELQAGYQIVYDDDFSGLDFYFNEALSKQEQANYFTYTETLCMMAQILLNNSDEYFIDINIYNSDSGDLVSNGNTTNGITWNIGE